MNNNHFNENPADPTAASNDSADNAESGAGNQHHEQVRTDGGLISMEELVPIIEKAKKKRIPYELLGYLWELWDTDPVLGEPPTVRSLDALAEVLKAFWEKDMEHELLSYLLVLEEGEDLDDKLWEPQPESGLNAPENLYQLVRKAWDQGRMDELIAMIEEYEDLVYGESISAVTVDFVEKDKESKADNDRKKSC